MPNGCWATVCKTVRPIPSDRRPVLSRLSVTLVYCGQTVGRIKMKLGMRVVLAPGHIVLWGLSSPSPKRGHSPQFLAHVYCDQTAGWIKMPLGMEVGLGPGHIMLDGDPAPQPQKGAQPPIFGRCLLGPNGRPSQLLLSTCFTKHSVGRVASGEVIVQLLKSKCLPALYAIAWTHEHWTVIRLDHWSSLSTAVYLGRFLR